jgi:gliding motility-associated-like protein
MPMPNVLVTPSDTQGCAPVCVNFSGSSSTSKQNCAWDFGDGNSSVSCTPAHCFNAQGIFKISLTITDVNGCSGVGTSTVSVHPMPKADFTADPQPTTILDPKVQFHDQTTQAVVTSWHWNFGAWGLADTSRLKNPSYTYKDTGSYLVTLLVSTAYGCKDSTEKLIRVEDDYELYVPSAFSPNNDGLNETFLPIASGVKASGYNLYIYDRWGNLVFHSTDLSVGWDGTIKNEVVLEDVYVWKILLKTTAGVAKQAHGIVSVVK